MKFTYFIEPPKIIRKIFSQLIWENTEPKICLTFDDGPFPEPTEKILKTLQQYKSKALFFITGKNGVKNLSLVDEITDEGHFIANHSYEHSKRMIWMNRYEIQNELLNTEILLFDRKNFLKLFRPPYGKLDFRIYREVKLLRYRIMMWSLLTEDYLGDFEIVKKNLDTHLRENSIIVFHNNPKSSNIIEKSLDYTFNLIEKRGYEVGSTFNF